MCRARGRRPLVGSRASAPRGQHERPAGVRQLIGTAGAVRSPPNDVVVLTWGGERIAEVTAFVPPDVVERFAVPAEIAARREPVADQHRLSAGLDDERSVFRT